MITSCARLAPSRSIRGSHLESTDDTLVKVDRALWGGQDVAEFLLRLLHAQRSVRDGSVTGPVERSVQVLGLQNTGTNLLFSMLRRNFASRVALYDWNYQADSPAPELRPGVWKHANLQVLHDYNASALDFITRDKVVAIMMVRDPMSWLQSMKKAPYELKPCVMGKDWITKPCPHPHPAGFYQAPPEEITDLEEMWNRWTRAYDHHDWNGFPEGIVVRYEDLVLEPELTMDMIAEKLDMKKPDGGWDVLDRSAKNHGDSHGRLEAMEKITSRSFMEEYAVSQVKKACSRLDMERMAEHQYDTC